MDSGWFYLDRTGRQGPVDLETLVAVLLGGPEPRRAKVWREGLQDWQEAGSLPEISGKLPPPAPPSTLLPADAAFTTFTDAEALARLYRRLVLLVGVQLLVGVFLNLAGEVFTGDIGMLLVLVLFVCAVATVIGLVITAYRLMRHLGSGVPILWAVAMFIPLVNVLVLLAISSKAQTWCRQFGIKVGLLGPTKRILSKALAGSHEVVRRARRGELCFAQSLLDELRANMTRLDAWIHGIEPLAPQDLKLAARVSPALANAFARSYVGLNASDIDDAVVALSNALAQQIPELHRKFQLNRPLATDLFAVDLVTKRQVA